ncbi:MAG: hypothetical protein K8R35_11345 [Bacteroidales bacterium]|nr:hypothetical protein [Bacteroidales bacterium]
MKFINTTYKEQTIGDTLQTGIIQAAYNRQFGPENAFKTAAYAHYFYSPFRWLKLNAGFRTDYFRIDARIDRRFVFRNYNITAFAEIWNLTNHENVISYDYSDDFLTKEPVTLFSCFPSWTPILEVGI